MFTLFNILLGLSLLFIGNIRQSNYGKIAFSVSERWKQNRSIVNVLNWMSRHFDEIYEQKIKPKLDEDLKSLSKQENAERRHEGYAITRMVQYLLGGSFAHMIELWNPKDGRKRRLLGKKEQKALKTGRETGYSKGGISPFRMTQIAYAIGKEYTNRHGNAWSVKEIDHEELFDIAESYHEQKEKERKARQTEKQSTDTETKTAETEQVASEITVDDYLEGNVKLSEIDNPELLEQFKEDSAITGGKKAAVTRRINELS